MQFHFKDVLLVSIRVVTQCDYQLCQIHNTCLIIVLGSDLEFPTCQPIYDTIKYSINRILFYVIIVIV